MVEFTGGPLSAHIPDDVTIPQFMLEYEHSLRPAQSFAGSTPCLIEDATGRVVSLQELRERTSALAEVLKETYNVGENEVVLLCSPNHVDYPVAMWAVMSIGAIFTGANPAYTPTELEYQLKLTEATLVIAHSSTLDAVLNAASLVGLSSNRVIILDSPSSSTGSLSTVTLIAPVLARGVRFSGIKLQPGEGRTRIAMLCMSSGTTGAPKAVAIQHTAIITHLIQLTALSESPSKFLCPRDVVMAVLPFFHVAGLVFNLHWMLFCGTTLVVIPKFDFIGMLNSIARYNIQHLMMVPPIAVALAKHPVVKKYDLSKVKFLGTGAAPMTSELQYQLKQLCPQAMVGQAYGLTETATILAMTPFGRQCTYGTVGMLLPGIQARVVKIDGSLAGYDEPGELVVKTLSMSLGYLKNKEASEEAFTSDGWFRTGDQVKISKNGEVSITDRLKELIKVRGFQVSPVELEGLILDHPDVSDVCVVGALDDKSGEVPLAFVVLTESASKRAEGDTARIKASIMKLVSDNKIKYKHLADVEFVPAIPKNASGKILRRILSEQVRQRAQRKAKL